MPTLHRACCCGSPPVCPPALTVSFAGVNATRCVGCFQAVGPPFYITQEVTSLLLDGTYTLPLTYDFGGACAYAALVPAAGALAWNVYTVAACAGVPLSRPGTGVRLAVNYDKLAARVLLVAAFAETGLASGPLPNGLAAFHSGDVSAPLAAEIDNALTCPGALVGAAGGTAVVTA